LDTFEKQPIDSINKTVIRHCVRNKTKHGIYSAAETGILMTRLRSTQTRPSGWTFPLLALGVLAAGLSPARADATTVRQMNLDDLVGYSALVVEGTVKSVSYDMGDEKHIPTTSYELCDIDVVVGRHDVSCLMVVAPGGETEYGWEGWAGMPTLDEGGRYLLFLNRTRDYLTPFVGWWQGVYRIVQGDDGPAVVSNAGHPVRGVSAEGKIITRRDVQVIPTNAGLLEHVDSSPPTFVSQRQAAREAISRRDFVDALHAVTNSRLLDGATVPDGLPVGWHCRDNPTWAAAEPPIRSQSSEVTP